MNVSERVLRSAMMSDLDRLCALETATHGIGWTAQHLAQSIVDDDVIHRVVIEGGRMVAHGCMRLTNHMAYLANVAVAEDVRRQGLARMLVTDLLAGASSRVPHASCQLDVQADNVAAVALYRSFGFAPCGIRRQTYKSLRNGGSSDSLVMVLDVVTTANSDQKESS